MNTAQPNTAPSFFMPDGEGGHVPPDATNETYAAYRQLIETATFWPGSFTDRQVFEVTSVHNGQSFTTRVGEVADMQRCIAAILHSVDEHGRSRYVACSLRGSLIHMDATTVTSSLAFAD